MKLPFDEQQLLRDNMPYLLRSLGLTGISIHSTADAAAAAAAGADVGSAYPASPVVVLSAGKPAAAAAASEKREPALAVA